MLIFNIDKLIRLATAPDNKEQSFVETEIQRRMMSLRNFIEAEKAKHFSLTLNPKKLGYFCSRAFLLLYNIWILMSSKKRLALLSVSALI